MTTDTYPKALSAQRRRRDDHLGRQGLGDDRAEHGDDARLHLHRRRVRRADARPRCCATRWTCRSTCSRSTATRARRTPARSSPTGSPARSTSAPSPTALTAGCIRMTEMLARDGEGATHLLRATVRGAKDVGEARRVAKSLVNSPLIKTMVHGADPERRPHPDGGRQVLRLHDRPETHRRVDQRPRGGARRRCGSTSTTRSCAPRSAPRSWTSRSSLGVGDAQATAYGCDLTQGYIDENAAYYSS